MENNFVNCLMNKKIEIVPIERDGAWLKKGDVGHFLFSGAFIELDIKRESDKGLIDPLQGCEKDTIQQIINYYALENGKDLSIHKKENNFWKDKKLRIDKNGITLDLSVPSDFIKYRIALGYTKILISPTWKERNNKLTYKFALKDVDEVIDTSAMEEKDRIKAYKYFGKLESNDIDMYDYLLTYYYITRDKEYYPNITWKRDKFIDKIGKIIDKDIKKFNSILDDPKYKIRTLIYNAIVAGELKVVQGKYQYPKADAPIGDIGQAVEYFADTKNNEEYLVLKTKVENSKKALQI